jgi:hypothetical protein
MSELEAFRTEIAAWFRDNRPPEPDFLLPESFMEVGTDAQFEYLRNWQRKIYEAGYLGMAWPAAYGGGGRPQVFQDIVNAEMVRQKVPFVPNTIGLNWAGPLILAIGTEAEKQRQRLVESSGQPAHAPSVEVKQQITRSQLRGRDVPNLVGLIVRIRCQRDACLSPRPSSKFRAVPCRWGVGVVGVRLTNLCKRCSNSNSGLICTDKSTVLTAT